MTECYVCEKKLSEEEAKKCVERMNKITGRLPLEQKEQFIQRELGLVHCAGPDRQFMNGEPIVCDECINRALSNVRNQSVTDGLVF